MTVVSIIELSSGVLGGQEIATSEEVLNQELLSQAQAFLTFTLGGAEVSLAHLT